MFDIYVVIYQASESLASVHIVVALFQNMVIVISHKRWTRERRDGLHLMCFHAPEICNALNRLSCSKTDIPSNERNHELGAISRASGAKAIQHCIAEATRKFRIFWLQIHKSDRNAPKNTHVHIFKNELYHTFSLTFWKWCGVPM